MKLTLWTYEGPPHVGAMRVATAMEGLHYVLHAPQGDTYADLLFTMIERRGKRPPVSYTTFQARDLGADTAGLFKQTARDAHDRFRPQAMIVGASCTAELIQDDPSGLAETLGLDCPVIPLDLPSYSRKENFGADETFHQIVRHLSRPRARTAEVTCNLLGATALGFRHRDDVTEVTRLLAAMGVTVNVCAPLGATPADIARLPAAHFNVVLYPETGESAARWLEKTHGQPWTRTVPIGTGATRDFLAEVATLTGLSPQVPEHDLRQPWWAVSVDSTYLTGKRVFIFGDATHAMAAARIAAEEIGFEVVGLGCFNREFARPMRAAAARRSDAGLATEFPGLLVRVHAAAEWSDPVALAAAREDIARADLVVANLLFLEEHIRQVLPELQAARARVDALVGIIADSQIVKLTRMGELEMGKPDGALMALMKKLKPGKGAASGQSQMAMLRRLPKILRFVPGRPQDLRAWFLSMQYWLGGSDENIREMIRFLIGRYAARKDRAQVKAKAPVEYPEVGLYHPDMVTRVTEDPAALPRPASAVARVGLLMLRSYILAGDTAHYDAVIRAFEGRGVQVLPVFAAGLHGRPAIAAYLQGVDALVSLTGFSLVGGPAYNDSAAAVEVLADLDVPYVAAHPLEFQTLGQWGESRAGLSPIETTMLIALPEIDGATNPTVFAGRHGPGGCDGCARACRPQADARAMAPCSERIEALADKVLRLARLRRSRVAERRVGADLRDQAGRGQDLGLRRGGRALGSRPAEVRLLTRPPPGTRPRRTGLFTPKGGFAMADQDFTFEPAPGLPAPLPPGETILWQGHPDRKALARQAYKANWILGYMLVLALWRGGAAWDGPVAALAHALPYALLALAAWGVVQGLAAWQARASIYTLTTERVILRIGAALPITFTIPFRRIGQAALADEADGTGTIALSLTGDVQMSTLVLWPHLRPGFVKRTQPALRCIPEAVQVGRLLSDAAQASISTPEVSLAVAAE